MKNQNENENENENEKNLLKKKNYEVRTKNYTIKRAECHLKNGRERDDMFLWCIFFRKVNCINCLCCTSRMGKEVAL
jgi:hypothetical protein